MDPDVVRALRALHDFAQNLSRQGVPREEIQRQLMARGLNEVAAGKIVAHVEDPAAAASVPVASEARPRRRYGTPDMNDDDGADGPTLEAMQDRLAKSEARADILHGALITGAGVLFTAVTYSLASGTGGVFVVATGAILFGLSKLGKGLMNL